ncbi:hypothetical protein DDZ13_09675 [Coraliomargarita sinensis]|uniref:Uncharacterized protein n=1 Tax=Coraliomargarita sinensis TaxID=2174842 RepID=A0A317ZJF0_9BACT|nr:hypothetical protein [Coraliomargarita sinensis]PXA03899.1 hypothetical protein DDZ13_09675 [Coraliomargarita sinensis]
MKPDQSLPIFEDIDQHPGNSLMLALLSYGSTKDILSVNSFEVLRFIQEIESGRFSEMALDRSRRLEYRDFENHMVRYFHNFLAAVKTMVEHTRNMMRSELISEDHRNEYQEELKELFSDDLPKFIEDFRNYTLHYGLPKISHVCSLPEEKWQVILDLKQLHDWDKWTSRSKRFMKEHPDQIRLSWLVETYQEKALTMHQWLVHSFTRHYGNHFEEFDRLRAAFFSANKDQSVE